MLWEAIKVGRVRGCPAPWHKQAPGGHSHLHKYSLRMRMKERVHTGHVIPKTAVPRPSYYPPALQLTDPTVNSVT